MNKIVWVKPSGIEIVSNDLPATIAAAQALGWKQKKERKNGSQGSDEQNEDQNKDK